MDLSIGVIRLVLFVSNGIFACTGVAILAMSAVIYKEMNVYSQTGNFIESKYAGILITLMVVGSLVILVTLLGLYGTIRENQKILMAFAVMLFVIYVCEIVLSTLAFLRSNDIDVRIKNAMIESFGNYRFDPKISNSYNTMQRNLQCCGVKGPTDYWPMFSGMVPASCCLQSDGEMCLQSTYSYKVYQTGCFEAVRDFVARSGVILGSVTLSLAFSEVLAIVFALLLIIQLYREEKKMGIHLKPGYSFETIKPEPQESLEMDSKDPKAPKPHKGSKSKSSKPQPHDLEVLDFQLQDIEVENRPPQEVDEVTFQQDEVKPLQKIKDAPVVKAAPKSSPKAAKALKPSPESIKALQSSTSTKKSSQQEIPIPQTPSSSSQKLEDQADDSAGTASSMTEV